MDKTVKLAAENVGMRFGEIAVLADVDLAVEDGEFVSLLGPSGCGKTTLLNLAAGLLKPTGGRMALDGETIVRPGADRCLVFQDDAVFPWYSVQRNAEYGLRLAHMPRAVREERVSRILELVGLSGREQAYPWELSGGMRKRVDLARALALQPEVLLMDEPFAALDAMTKSRLQLDFLRIWDLHRMTVLFVTHDIEEAIFMSDRVVVMGTDPGRVVHEIAVPYTRPRARELRTDASFQRLRQSLIEVLDEIGRPRDERLPTPPEADQLLYTDLV